MPLIARQRSRLAVLAVLALVGSLLAVSAVPAVAAGGQEGEQRGHLLGLRRRCGRRRRVHRHGRPFVRGCGQLLGPLQHHEGNL